MPKGPGGEKRPADVIGAAIKVAKIATGEIAEDVGVDGKGQGGRQSRQAGRQSARRVANKDAAHRDCQEGG
jgi:hypothetical protein